MVNKQKWNAGRYKFPVHVTEVDGRVELKFSYNKALIKEIKNMEKYKWHPDRKIWSVPLTFRNQFTMAFLRGENPYARWDADYDFPVSDRPFYAHQREMFNRMRGAKWVEIAGEMGTGKTLPCIELIDQLDLYDHKYWYVGPKAGVRAVSRELRKWKCAKRPNMYTYEGFTKQKFDYVPQVIIFDEASKIKTPTSKRSKKALKITNQMRDTYGEDCYIILLSGTPAPRVPTDWWHQCEVACPGYLAEPNIYRLRERLSIVEQRESLLTGGVYPHIVTWLDDERKCKICGKTDKEHALGADHAHVPSENEVAKLHKRMSGLVLVKFKKDCLDLPDKIYETIRVKPTPSILRMAKHISLMARRTIESLTLLRELSDGFQYKLIDGDKKTCTACKGKGKISTPVPIEDVDPFEPLDIKEEDFEEDVIDCPACFGTGEQIIKQRGVDHVGSPKDDIFKELLDEHSELGRFVVWAGFTATVDRLVDMAIEAGWNVLRVDGRGYAGFDTNRMPLDSNMLLDEMDYSHPDKDIDKLCFVGHPQAGGMALTLTASPTELFYSNSFSGEARIQAEDRIHRAGMDPNTNARIIDLIHLPTDQLVLDNLKKKRRLQSLTLGEVNEALLDKGNI